MQFHAFLGPTEPKKCPSEQSFAHYEAKNDAQQDNSEGNDSYWPHDVFDFLLILYDQAETIGEQLVAIEHWDW